MWARNGKGEQAMPDTRKEWGCLMAAAQRGQGAAYRQLLDEIRRWLVRFYLRRLPPSFVEDAVQETLIAIHEKRHTYDPQRPFQPWLMAVARYKWIDRLRTMKRSATQELPEDIAIDDHECTVTSAVVLKDLLGMLKPAQAEAIRLVRLEGWSVEEASARAGQSPALIKVNVHRGLARLTDLIGQHEGA
jgi:RNA polymerase sigma-70 factor (ECF subfamily)